MATTNRSIVFERTRNPACGGPKRDSGPHDPAPTGPQAKNEESQQPAPTRARATWLGCGLVLAACADYHMAEQQDLKISPAGIWSAPATVEAPPGALAYASEIIIR